MEFQDLTHNHWVSANLTAVILEDRHLNLHEFSREVRNENTERDSNKSLMVRKKKRMDKTSKKSDKTCSYDTFLHIRKQATCVFV